MPDAVCQHAAMSRRTGLTIAAGVGAFAALTTLVGMWSGAPPDFLVLDLATGLSFVLAGLVAVSLRPRSPAGPMLMASGALWYVGSYAPTLRPVVMHLGFAFEGYYDLVLAALLLILSAPTHASRPRPLIAALAVAMVARSLGRLLLTDPARLGCTECPPNPFAIWPDEHAFAFIEVATCLAMAELFIVVAVIGIRRLLRSGPVLRRVRWPIVVAGGLATGAAAFDAFEYAWTTATASPLVALAEPWDMVFHWSMFGVRTVVPIGFVFGLLRLRSAPGPVGSFAAGLERPVAGTDVGDALRSALGDPSLVLLRSVGQHHWITETGEAADPPAAGDDPARAITLVGLPEKPLAALVHDAALLEQPELVGAVVRVLRLILENDRLKDELRDQLAAVMESRARIVTAAADERRRIERDLHDGAQQRLVGVTLALQRARVAADVAGIPAVLREQLDAASSETGEAMRELRELARGIHPAILEDEGLGAAVTALARRTGVPVDLHLDLDGRLPALVESTAYFTIAEALMNTQRHAGAAQASVRLARIDGALELVVRDDGAGGASLEHGSGIRGLADRVAAVGGRFEVDSQRGRGTTIRATIPVP